MVGIVGFAANDTVTATVTAQSITIDAVDGVVAYGTIAVSGSQNTVTLGDTQSVVNLGNVNTDVSIQGQDSGTWELDLAVIGADQYTHEISTDGGTAWAFFDEDAYYDFVTALEEYGTESETQTFDLRISTPSSSTVYTSQSVDVSVQSAAS